MICKKNIMNKNVKVFISSVVKKKQKFKTNIIFLPDINIDQFYLENTIKAVKLFRKGVNRCR